MENKGYLIYEVGILGGNDKVKTNLFVLFVLKRRKIMNIEDIRKEIEKEIDAVKDLKELNELHVKYLSKKGIITELNSHIKDVPNDKK